MSSLNKHDSEWKKMGELTFREEDHKRPWDDSGRDGVSGGNPVSDGHGVVESSEGMAGKEDRRGGEKGRETAEDLQEESEEGVSFVFEEKAEDKSEEKSKEKSEDDGKPRCFRRTLLLSYDSQWRMLPHFF